MAKVGAPSKYKPEFCEQLVEHMKEGGSIDSFGAKIDVARQTIYNWLESQAEFLDARKRGEAFLHQFYERLGRMIATGQIRRLKSERPLVIDGKVQYDGNGDVIFEREWEYTTGGQAAFIFMCKNLLKWRDRTDLQVGDKPDTGGPGSMDFSGLTDEQLEQNIGRLFKKAREPAAKEKKR